LAATAVMAPATVRSGEDTAAGELVRRTRHTAAAHSLPRHLLMLTVVVAVFVIVAAWALPGSGQTSVGGYEVTADGVELVRAGASPEVLTGRGALADGDVVRTDESGAATLALTSGTVLRMGPATSLEVSRAIDDDPARTPLHRISLHGGRLWVRHDEARDPAPVVVEAPAVSIRIRSGGLDMGCGPAGCAIAARVGTSAATVGWDRFRVHAGEAVSVGPGGEVGELRAVDPATLEADPWVTANAQADVAAGFAGLDSADGVGLDDAEIEGTWSVSSEVAESSTPDRPVGGEPQRTWGVTRSCVDGTCRLEIVDVAGETGAVGTARPEGDRQVVDGVTRTYDCVDSGTGATTVENAVAETRRVELWATAARRTGGRWVASALAGTGDGTERWAGRGRVCRGIRPGAWSFVLSGVRIDLPAHGGSATP